MSKIFDMKCDNCDNEAVDVWLHSNEEKLDCPKCLTGKMHSKMCSSYTIVYKGLDYQNPVNSFRMSKPKVEYK